MFHLAGIFRTLSLGGGMSNGPEGTAPRSQREESDDIQVLQGRAGSLSIRRLFLTEGRSDISR